MTGCQRFFWTITALALARSGPEGHVVGSKAGRQIGMGRVARACGLKPTVNLGPRVNPEHGPLPFLLG